MTPLSLMRQFHALMYDKTLRGQKVAGVELIIELNGGNPEPQLFLLAVFAENPPSGESEERDLLQKVFSEIPSHARLLCQDEQQLLQYMTGTMPIPPEAWKLEDES